MSHEKDDYLLITPKAELKYNTLYSVLIPKAAVKDKTGNNLAADYTFRFITEIDPGELEETSASEENTSSGLLLHIIVIRVVGRCYHYYVVD